MNFEVYKPGKYDESKQRAAPEKTLSAREKLSEKERKLEVKKTLLVCTEYHRKLDSAGSYFNSKAAKEAARLLPYFRAIKMNKLPECLRNVLKHRIAYLELMNGLGQNEKFMKLLDKFQPSAFNAGLFTKDVRNIQKSPEFKKLSQKDVNSAYKIVRSALDQLKELNKIQGNWQNEAKTDLQAKGSNVQDARVDDQDAAKNLEKGLQIVANNLLRIQVGKVRKAA